MNPRDTVAGWLQRLGSEMSEPPRFNTQGVCGLQWSDEVGDITVYIEVPDTAGPIVVNAPICVVPDDPEARLLLYEELLARNLIEPLLSGGHLALDREGGLLVLGFVASVTRLGPDSFVALIQQARHGVEQLRRLLGLTGPVFPDQEITPIRV